MICQCLGSVRVCSRTFRNNVRLPYELIPGMGFVGVNKPFKAMLALIQALSRDPSTNLLGG